MGQGEVDLPSPTLSLAGVAAPTPAEGMRQALAAEAEALQDEDLLDGEGGEAGLPATPGADPARLALARGPAAVCAWLMLARALAAAPDARVQGWLPGSALIVHVPPGPWASECAQTWDLLIRAIEPSGSTPADTVAAAAQARARRALGTSPEMPIVHQALDAQSTCNPVLHPAVRRGGRPIHGVSINPGRLLPPELIAAADITLSVQPPDAALLAELAEVLALAPPEIVERLGGPVLLAGGERGVVGRAATPEVLRTLAHTVTPLLIALAWRPGQAAPAYLERLAELLQRQRRLATPPARTTLTLDALHGLGEAGEWARKAARDLAAYRDGRIAWSEVPRGALLVGAPGTGKTLLAQALANSAGVPLLTGSLARWQADDEAHLGTTLRAMRRTFADARLAAPSVLLIDEVDSFGDRASFDARHRDYSTQVVNALLECLDGAEPRDGVLVVATCNSAANIDPAILRAGRLDAVLSVPPPDAAALGAVFRLYLGDAIPADAQDALAAVARAAQARGATGATAEQWCREARARARSEARPVTVADLAAIVGPAPPEPSPAARWRTAVHEAGHAVAYLAIDPGLLTGLRLRSEGDTLGGTGVSLDALNRIHLPTRADLLRIVRAHLAGRAAEGVLLGEPSAGAGGAEHSDLARATRIALAVVARHGLSGAPDALVWRGHKRTGDPDLLADPDLRLRVAEVLAAAYASAERLMQDNAPGVLRLAEVLVRTGEVGVAEAADLLGAIQDRDACSVDAPR